MTVAITVLGIVQGVGFRPFVARLAKELKITGTVRNSGGIVRILANGASEAVDSFIHRLKSQQPCGAQILRIQTEQMPEQRFEEFTIISSSFNSEETPLIPPDLPLCEACGKELYDPGNRRYRYPFISCVACGPRYSIMDTLPYDRETTAMADFPMCSECAHEYSGNDRRQHAQTISCHDCGPQLLLQLRDAVYREEDALDRAIELLKNGAVLAVKGIGGYQFACLPTDKAAVERLRLLKHREKKPFAVMFPNIGLLKEYCIVRKEEEKLLLSTARPIVLLQKKKDTFCFGVSGESRFLGAFLAYTPLHQLLTDACGALVMTSGNLTAEPMMIEDGKMLALRSPYLAGVLYSLRQIRTPLDDSVARVLCGKPQVIRRGRGYVPLPVWLGKSANRNVLAVGGDLKSTFCLYEHDRAYLSQYFGDLENYAVTTVYRENLIRMRTMLNISPDIIACDLHPNYLSTALAKKLAFTEKKKLIQIQHHHAHIASVMAEQNLQACIGIAFDGTGYGTDGAVWGGEFLLCRGVDYERRAHLSYVTLCGGDAAAKNAELTADCYRYAAGRACSNSEFDTVRAALAHGINSQKSSSMGRLFDAVSAVLKLKSENTYEGECAIALENAAADAEKNGIAPYPLHFSILYGAKETTIDVLEMVGNIEDAAGNGISCSALALGFHLAIVQAVCAVCADIRLKSGENAVALSGGVFSNLLLTQRCTEELQNAGFQVYLNEAVPANDGGISLGQAWLCGQMTEE
jgi:hydrogenase maturation protein HypF